METLTYSSCFHRFPRSPKLALLKLLLRSRFSGFLARKTHTTAKIQVPVGQQGTDGQFINCKTAINSSAYTKFQSSKSQWIDDHKLSYKYDTADTKSQNHFVEKGNAYSDMLKTLAVPPTLGAEVLGNLWLLQVNTSKFITVGI